MLFVTTLMKPNEPTRMRPRVAVAPGLGPRWSTLLLHALAVYQDIQQRCLRALREGGSKSCELPPHGFAAEIDAASGGCGGLPPRVDSSEWIGLVVCMSEDSRCPVPKFRNKAFSASSEPSSLNPTLKLLWIHLVFYLPSSATVAIYFRPTYLRTLTQDIPVLHRLVVPVAEEAAQAAGKPGGCSLSI